MGRPLQDCLTNRLDQEAAAWLVGIVGESPSKQSRAPSLWNPLLRAMEINARYVPFDVEPGQLEGFLAAARQDERVKGFNVTVPYKQRILPLLDEVEPQAGCIGAVDTVTRDRAGRLIGSNTEGSGSLAGLTVTLPGEPGPFIDESAGLQGLSVLLLGAGCVGRALAWHLAEAVGTGHLYLANRTAEKGRELCDKLKGRGFPVRWVEETAIDSVAPRVHLIINATSKGQAGFWTLADGTVTCLEPYSALAPANPVSLPADSAKDAPQFYKQWYRASLPDIFANVDRSARVLASLPAPVRLADLAVSPVESVMLRQARLAGRRTMGGKGLHLCQVAESFLRRIFRDHFEPTGQSGPDLYRTILEKLWTVW